MMRWLALETPLSPHVCIPFSRNIQVNRRRSHKKTGQVDYMSNIQSSDFVGLVSRMTINGFHLILRRLKNAHLRFKPSLKSLVIIVLSANIVIAAFAKRHDIYQYVFSLYGERGVHDYASLWQKYPSSAGRESVDFAQPLGAIRSFQKMSYPSDDGQNGADIFMEIEKEKASASDYLQVMFWTTLYKRAMHLEGRDRFMECEVKSCTYVRDRSRYLEVDAIIFHMQDIMMNDLPPKRKPSQKWILYGRESPINTNVSSSLNNLFNATYTYRRDSDILYPYGMAVPDKRPVERENFAEGKSELVAWVVSNCNTQSRREKYVRELQKHIKVDEYGGCSGRRCDDADECELMVKRRYKFFIAFENSLCKDYVSEKPWKGLLFHSIPIVMGLANYSRILPENSFIDVKNFSSPSALAEYLHQVDNDDALYNSYFKHQMNYRLRYTRIPHTCHLCAYLNERKNATKIYTRIGEWWNRCVSPTRYFKGIADMLL